MSSAIIVIPCYNEAQRLPIHAFKAFACAGHPQRFLFFVNDGSTDGTVRVLKTLHDDDPERYALCDLPRNVGKAEAVRTGVLLALLLAPTISAIGTLIWRPRWRRFPPSCTLLDVQPNLEMVFGARVRLLGGSIERSALRHYLGRMFATAASITLGLGIYDLCNCETVPGVT